MVYTQAREVVIYRITLDIEININASFFQDTTMSNVMSLLNKYRPVLEADPSRRIIGSNISLIGALYEPRLNT